MNKNPLLTIAALKASLDRLNYLRISSEISTVNHTILSIKSRFLAFKWPSPRKHGLESGGLATRLALSFCVFAFLPLQVEAQTRALPKAGFSNFSGSGSLPNAGGVHLQDGQDRPRGAPEDAYNPGEPSLGHKIVRWESRFMPLKVYVSPGKKLPEEPISVINAQRPQEVLSLLKANPNALSALPTCPGWSPELNSAAIQGIEQWKQFQNEGLFSFEFVDDPTIANIFLFWAERFTGDEGVGGVSTGGNTVAVLYDANEVRTREASIGQPLQGTPVIIELQVMQDSYERLQARAAHEFGHALGIKAHSPYNQDLMCVNGIAKLLSNSDKATIRWLYRQKPQYVMLPPIIPRLAAPVASAEQQQQQQSSESGVDEQNSVRPNGGYRIHVGRPTRAIDDLPASDSGGSISKPVSDRSSSGTNPGMNTEREYRKPAADNVLLEPKEKKEARPRKNKKHHDDDDAAASKEQAPILESVPKVKPSEGY